MSASTERKETRFDQRARITLAFVVILILGSVGQFAYRFTLPTDGW